MNIHEYQGKGVLRQYGVATPRGFPCTSADEAAEAATRLGGRAWVVKAQIHAGGRGKGGGVRRAWSVAEVRQHATALLGTPLKTRQTGPEGRVVRRLLVEERIEIERELYLGMAVDRESRRVALTASGQGSAHVEGLTARGPDTVHKLFIDPGTGLRGTEAEVVARRIGLSGKTIAQARTLMQNLYQAFHVSDASLAEIDPLVLTRDGRLMALDARFSFDSNALFRQPEIVAMRDDDEDYPVDLEAPDCELFRTLRDGNIGGMVNDAGLALATMDMIALRGGSPASFIEVGGAATAAKVAEAFGPMLRNPKLQAILVNVFGGIVRCDVIAEGVVAAARHVGLRVPLVVRMRGTHERLGKAILAQSGIPVISANDMAEAAELVVTAARWRD